MGYNSQSNIMKKLLLLGIAALVALCTACEKDKDEPKGSKDSNGNSYDPNKEYCWKGVFRLDDGSTITDYFYGTYAEASSSASYVMDYYYDITGYTMSSTSDSYCY